MNATPGYETIPAIKIARHEDGNIEIIGRTGDSIDYRPGDETIEIIGPAMGWGRWTHIVQVHDGFERGLYFARLPVS